MQNTNNASLQEIMDTAPQATSEETMDTPQATPAADLDSADPTIPGPIFQLLGTSGQTLTITTPPKNIRIRWGRVLKGEYHFQCQVCFSRFTKLCSLKTHQANTCLNKGVKKVQMH